MTETKNKNYFTHDTELAILEYVSSQDDYTRNKVYRERIHYAFFKLTQNLIHTFKFYYTEETNLEDLQHEVITFLLTKLEKFNPDKGAKAYSYFGTIAKRYLIASNQKNYKKRLEFIALDRLTTEQEEGDTVYGDILDTSTVEPINNESDIDELSEFTERYVHYCLENLYKLFPRDEDAKIADAILDIFKKRDKISIFNKKALYIYIREHIDVKTPKITKVANELGDIYKKHYIFYLEHGYINL